MSMYFTTGISPKFIDTKITTEKKNQGQVGRFTQ